MTRKESDFPEIAAHIAGINRLNAKRGKERWLVGKKFARFVNQRIARDTTRGLMKDVNDDRPLENV